MTELFDEEYGRKVRAYRIVSSNDTGFVSAVEIDGTSVEILEDGTLTVVKGYEPVAYFAPKRWSSLAVVNSIKRV